MKIITSNNEYENVSTFMTISRCILPRMRNVLDKNCRENENTQFCSVTFSRKSWCLWDNVKKIFGGNRDATNDNTIWRMRVAFWISKATCADAHARPRAWALTHTHACAHTEKDAVLIVFPRLELFCERASLLHVHWLSYLVFSLAVHNVAPRI